MKKYRVIDIFGSFGLFIDEEIEAEDETEAIEYVLYEIMDNLGNYIDVEVEEVPEDEEYEDEDEEDIHYSDDYEE